MVDVIKAVVNEETQFGDDAQLVTHALSQLIAYAFLVTGDVLQQLLAFL